MTLQISVDQYASLQRQGQEKFVARAAEFLRKEFPAIAGRADPEKLDAAIHYAIERAGRYDFVSERDIIGFLIAMLQVGPKFDEDPRLSALQVPLTGMPGTPPSVRMGFLLNTVSETIAARQTHAP